MDDPAVDLEAELQKIDRYRAWDKGNFEHAIAGAGQVSALIRGVKSVKEIIEEMVS